MGSRNDHVPEQFYPDENRDGIYPGEVAEQRPIGKTRIDCGGHTDHEESDSASERFNQRLRDQPLRGERG